MYKKIMKFIKFYNSKNSNILILAIVNFLLYIYYLLLKFVACMSFSWFM